MSNNIVTVNVSRTIAPAPSLLQQTGALVSQGGTTLATGHTSLLTQYSDLTALLAAALATTSLTWAAGVVTVVTTAPHGIPAGKTVQGVIAGVLPAAYNGTFACTYVSANSFSFPLASNPGATTQEGTFQPYSAVELQKMATTFFAQGSATSVLVLELGQNDDNTNIAALNTYIQNNLLTIYAFLVPEAWAGDASFVAMAGNYTSNTAMVYFYSQMSQTNYLSFTNIKSVFGLVPSPVENTATAYPTAAPFYKLLNYNPSNTNRVTPFAFSYLFGVQAWPNLNNGPTLTAFKTQNVNYVTTGAEGGISNTILKWGVTNDGRDVTYWYSIDWVQINLQRDIANAIINGSNDPINPLYYNQNGIDRLQDKGQQTMDRGITYGLVLAGTGKVNAVPFAEYTKDNPSDFPIGKYAGLSTSYTPNRGFAQIIFNVNVTDFISQ